LGLTDAERRMQDQQRRIRHCLAAIAVAFVLVGLIGGAS
jgi:hypothetical protein